MKKKPVRRLHTHVSKATRSAEHDAQVEGFEDSETNAAEEEETEKGAKLQPTAIREREYVTRYFQSDVINNITTILHMAITLRDLYTELFSFIVLFTFYLMVMGLQFEASETNAVSISIPAILAVQ
ncbi:hypothetical protein CYMTET_41173 [Cymbomonas tetramitiformis]|uniref:Uncharacterized protein n=1 Tax=Cymbomonas tetramitiformis TaxID=36881 RepID=A0AAE0F2T1_9CHLO|nr:hypothetical protein CYMTET_41173 [Cymbomonas tetramitiformis]